MKTGSIGWQSAPCPSVWSSLFLDVIRHHFTPQTRFSKTYCPIVYSDIFCFIQTFNMQRQERVTAKFALVVEKT
jgi:hypothetical protein